MSGMDSNGTAGAESVKAVGGICIAQDPDSAKFAQMPRSLIDSGMADFVLRPSEMPAVLALYAKHPYVTGEESAEELAIREGQALTEILALLRGRAREDFSGYKQPTLIRRIQRRMSLHQFTRMAEYAKSLRHARSKSRRSPTT